MMAQIILTTIARYFESLSREFAHFMALRLGPDCMRRMSDNTLISSGEFQFFLPGLSRIRPKGALRIYNKIGRAYGFTVDNSYVLVHTCNSFSPVCVWPLQKAHCCTSARMELIDFSQIQAPHFLSQRLFSQMKLMNLAHVRI